MNWVVHARYLPWDVVIRWRPDAASSKSWRSPRCAAGMRCPPPVVDIDGAQSSDVPLREIPQVPMGRNGMCGPTAQFAHTITSIRAACFSRLDGVAVGHGKVHLHCIPASYLPGVTFLMRYSSYYYRLIRKHYCTWESRHCEVYGLSTSNTITLLSCIQWLTGTKIVRVEDRKD